MKLIEQAKVTEPGAYRMSADAYHGDPCPTPSLSSSVAKLMLEQSPRHAFAKHPRLGGADDIADDKPTRAQEIGTAGHKWLLGQGRDVVIIPARDYRTKDAQAARDAAYIEGQVPILEADSLKALAMVERATAQLSNFGPAIYQAFSEGEAEVALAWQERSFWCRSLLDKLWIDGNRATIFDLKTTAVSADPYSTARRVFDLGYDFQVAFYRRGLAAIAPEVSEIKSLLISIEQEPPYALSVVELSHEAIASADKLVWQSLALWERCLKSDEWPGYPAVVATADLPSYLDQRRSEREMNDGLLNTLDLSAYAPKRREREVNYLAAG